MLYFGTLVFGIGSVIWLYTALYFQNFVAAVIAGLFYVIAATFEHYNKSSGSKSEATLLTPMSDAPTDGSYFLALTKPQTGSNTHYGDRWFVIRYISENDWALFPGFGVGMDWFVGWTHLPEEAKS